MDMHEGHGQRQVKDKGLGPEAQHQRGKEPWAFWNDKLSRLTDGTEVWSEEEKKNRAELELGWEGWWPVSTRGP